MKTILVEVDPGREVAEIAQDFTKPIEVVREALHNASDAGATKVDIVARVQEINGGRRVLTLEFRDDGEGMNEKSLEAFFGLGKSLKQKSSRRTIGQKGHGTKIFYQSGDIHLATRDATGRLLYARVSKARDAIHRKQTPTPELFEGSEATRLLNEIGFEPPSQTGTVIRLVEFTADASRLIDEFRKERLEDYLRWFTVYGSFEHNVHQTSSEQPFALSIQATDMKQRAVVEYGHNWPTKDRTAIKELKKKDERRPFQYFVKSFRFPNHPLVGGYSVDVVVLFEGRKARMERDPGISRQRSGGLYAEEERYGIWLCRDFIPIEFRPEWLLDENCPKPFGELRSPLILVNCQDFKLIANRGSVGNSTPQLLEAVKNGVFQILDEVQDNKDVAKFLEEYQEDLFGRLRDKDSKALHRRIERYNHKRKMTVKLGKNHSHTFWEPQREITLFGLVAELNIVDKTVLGFEILDYDDKFGLDLLVRRNGTGQLMEKSKVAYVELKFELHNQVNHAFDHLYAIVCWNTYLTQDEKVFDATNTEFKYSEHKNDDGVTYSQLVPLPGGKINHNVRVIVLQRLLEEKYQLASIANPNPIKK